MENVQNLRPVFSQLRPIFYLCKVLSNIKLKQKRLSHQFAGPTSVCHTYIKSIYCFCLQLSDFCTQTAHKSAHKSTHKSAHKTAHKTAYKTHFNLLNFTLLETLSSVCTISIAMFVFGNNHTLLGCTILNQFLTGFRQHILLL